MYLHSGEQQQRLKIMRGIEEKQIFEGEVRLGVKIMNRAKLRQRVHSKYLRHVLQRDANPDGCFPASLPGS